ncbi:MAG: VCBS repeat-containing protein, partial [Rhodothermales bacterium]|nr:VCBS repeat-containing protein [Rhodothermales bacterium]
VAEGQFEKRTERFIYAVDLGSETIVKAADLDADGDLDLLVGNKIQPDDNKISRVYHYENTGSPTSPAFVMRGPVELLGTYHQNPAFGDLDADGDLDFLLGKWNKEIGFFRNEGTPSDFEFVEVDGAWLSITRGSNTTPALVDIDADGDLDLFVGESSGSLNFYRNTGSASEPVFELVSDSYLDIDSGRRSFPAFVDIDGDGDQDMVLGSELDGLYLYLNTGTPEQHEFELWGTLDVPVQPLSAPEFADIDGDGDMDLLVGGTSGGIQYFENVSQ